MRKNVEESQFFLRLLKKEALTPQTKTGKKLLPQFALLSGFLFIRHDPHA